MTDHAAIITDALDLVAAEKPWTTQDAREALADLISERDMQKERAAEKDRLWVSGDRCTFVRVWASGTCEIAYRSDPSHTWGPPITLTEEKT